MDDKLIRLARKIKDLENEQKKISQIMDLEKYLFVNHDISAENEGSIRNIVNNFYEEVRDNNFKEKGKFDTLESRINEIKEDIQEICISIDQSLTDIRETSQRERDNHKQEISTRFMVKDNEISQLRKENINLINQLQDLKNVINDVSKIKQERGNDGKSAYEIACELGFQGTVEEWLKSLHGRDGQDIELRGLRAFRDAPKDNKMYARKNKKWVEVESGGGTAEQSDWNETDTSSMAYIKNKPTIPSTANMEVTTNKVTSINSSSTNTQYPSAKAVYDLVGNIETILETLDIRRWS